MRQAFDQIGPRAPLGEDLRGALDRAWAAAEAFEAEIRKEWPHGRGRRPPLASDLVIAALHRGRFTDERIAELLNDALARGKRIPGVSGELYSSEYVKQRRKRAEIRRAPPPDSAAGQLSL